MGWSLRDTASFGAFALALAGLIWNASKEMAKNDHQEVTLAAHAEQLDRLNTWRNEDNNKLTSIGKDIEFLVQKEKERERR